mmetsp:Transcript_31771/g.66813  ORF Transcript_31771/g.66813 Transcript_31771/m.66813 type:complete len:157 (+) Transcript_31771:94-564(+)
MNPSKLFPLLSFALATTISSSHELHSAPTHPRSNDVQDSLSPPGHKTVRELYGMETIELNQEPCMSMPVVVENITDKPTVPPTLQPSSTPSMTSQSLPETTTTTTTSTMTTTTTATEPETIITQSPNENVSELSMTVCSERMILSFNFYSDLFHII